MGINGLLKALSPLLIPENYESSHINANLNANVNTSANNDSANINTNPKPGSSYNSNHNYKYNIQQFANKSLAIDASGWLFKASYSCAEKLVEGIERHGLHYIDPQTERTLCNYMIRRCEELIQHASIQCIYLVFDGLRCPLKDVTNRQREDRRRECLREARRLKNLGKGDLAGDKYKACVKVTEKMAECVARAVQKKWGVGSASALSSSRSISSYYSNNSNNSQSQQSQCMSRRRQQQQRVTCIFSPYEADAQLVKLCIDGITDAIVTEDSDVLVYSAACNLSFPIIYKLSRDDGSCDVFTMDWLLSPSPPSSSSSLGVSTSTVQTMSNYPSFRRRLITPHSYRCQNSKITTKNNRKGDCKYSSKNNKNHKNNNTKKQKPVPVPALLSHLHALLSREKRQRGSGARMFVQACVLAGCDYAPSRLAGVGLVTAFKMIKENAHRNVGVRFSHVLNSMPREKILLLDDGEDVPSAGGAGVSVNTCTKSTKSSGGDISHAIQTYETLLAKSEAVFYYHHVRHLDSRRVVPLNERNQGLTAEGSHGQFLPCTSRFDDDISFTGTGFDSGVSSIRNSNNCSAGTVKKALSIPSPVPSNPYSVNRRSPFNSNNSLKSKKTDNRSQNTNIVPAIISPEENNRKKSGIRSFLTAKKDQSQPITHDPEGQVSSSKKSKKIDFSKYVFPTSQDGTNTPESKHNANVATKFTASSKTINRPRQQQMNHSDSDSDDILDESSDHFYSEGRTNINRQCSIITNSTVRNSQTSYTSLSSSELLPSNKNELRRSKYFTFDATLDKRSDSEDSLDPILSPVFVPKTVTPKILATSQSEEIGELNDNIEDFDYHNEESNDCVIVNNPCTKDIKRAASTNIPKAIPSGRRSSQSIFEKHQSQTKSKDENEYQKDFPQKTKSSSRFFGNSVQRERPRDEFFTINWAMAHTSGSTSKRNQKHNSIAISSSVKKRRKTTTSIKSFFVPLNTTKKS